MRIRSKLVTSLAALALATPAHAMWGQPAGGDPYAYQDYLFRQPGDPLPTDLGGDVWKYSSKNACQLYGQNDPRCSPVVTNNPQELNGVTGASVDKAWLTTTGRPDVVLAVTDSGIKWNDVGAMNDLAAKVFLNRGELPEPDWGVRDAAHPYDRNDDGVVNLRDWTNDSRVSDLNGNGILDPEDLIFLFSDGVDTDGNGYPDDIAGWDTFEDDNDPFDEVQYGHGTGEARDSTAEVDNGGDAGVCPNCLVMPMRVGDSFIANVDDFAEGVLYATDNGASLIQSALGTLNNSRFAQQAIDYAYKRGVVLVASAADESAGHHNQPSVLEHAVTMNSVGEPESPAPGIPSYLEFRGCTNYGAYITAAVPSNSCSSEAVGRSAGMVGLAYSAGRNAVAKGAIADYGALDGPGGVTGGRALSAEEIDQLVATTADDLNFVTPVDITARPDLGHTQRYPATQGWDPFFGYGRINADSIVRAVATNRIPPEADVTSPTWFDVLDPGSPIRIEGRVAALRATSYSYQVKWALWSWRDANAAPAYTTDGVTQTGTAGTDPYAGLLATIDPAKVSAALAVANAGTPADSGPAVDPITGRGDHENRQIPDKFGVIVRVEVTARGPGGTPLTAVNGGPLTGVGTKQFHLHHDPALLPTFPRALQGDGAAAPRFADLDDDGKDELVVATSNGEIHAFARTGELPGWPVKTTPYQVFSGAPAYQSGEIDPPHAGVLRSPAVGDIDRDGTLEVLAGDFMGRLWAWRADGSVVPGFPVRTRPEWSSPQPADRAAGFYGGRADLVPDLVNRRGKLNRTTWWLLAAPSLGDIDPAYPGLEIVAGAGDRHLYAWHADGTPVAGWPVMLRDPATLGSVDPVTHEITNKPGIAPYNGAKIVVSPAIGDLDGDGVPEVVATVNEQYAEPPNTDDPAITALSQAQTMGNDRVYAVGHDGHFLPGWPAKIATAALELLPVVGDGPTGSPILGDVDGDGALEVAVFGTAGPVYILNKSGSSIYGKDASGRDRTLSMAGVGALSNSLDTPSIPAAGGAAFVDLLGVGKLSLAAPAAGLGKLVDLLLPEDQLLSDNHLSVWDLSGTRMQLPAFPREVNDLQFLTTPTAADIDGDGHEEVFTGTAYSDLHAFDLTGTEPGMRTLAADGWPKFTAGWSVAPPSFGDFDGDGRRDVAHVIREGRLFGWRGNGASTCAPASWREFGHDGWMSNDASVDALRPAKVHDLRVTGTGPIVTVRWMAPGDDGGCGRAALYDVRWSTSPITAANFDAATPVIGEPSPSPAGTHEEVALVRPASGTLYFALRSWDALPATATAAHPANPSALAST